MPYVRRVCVGQNKTARDGTGTCTQMILRRSIVGLYWSIDWLGFLFMALLEARALVKRFDHVIAVNQLSFTVDSGEFFTLLGPSGCGKTTLLRMLAGFMQPDAGMIFLGGHNMTQAPPEARPVHTVFQNYALFPHLTVAQNIAFPLKIAGVGKDEIRARVAQSLADVALPQCAARYPHEISAGQRQRVAIARALIQRPRILLLDEPLSALDAKLRVQMQRELIALQREVGIAFVYVTHDQNEALALSDRVAVMNEGHIVQIDSPEAIYGVPQTRFVAGFIGQCNLLDAEVMCLRDGRIDLAVAGLGEVQVFAEGGVREGDKGAFAVRPEKIRLAPLLTALSANEICLRGRIGECIYLGNVTLYAVHVGVGACLEVLLPNTESGTACFYEVGHVVELAWSIGAGHFLRE